MNAGAISGQSIGEITKSCNASVAGYGIQVEGGPSGLSGKGAHAFDSAERPVSGRPQDEQRLARDV